MAFKTKSERLAAGEPIRDGPFDGVPGHLLSSLHSVLLSFAFDRGRFLPQRVQQLERVTKVTGLMLGLKYEELNYRENVASVSGDGALLLLDGVLEISGFETAQQVNTLLSEAGSIFRVVSKDFGTAQRIYALERRLPVEVDDAIEALKHAQAHLHAARSLIFGRKPDFKKGLHECVCAVEAASIPITQPNNAKATLGHVIGEMKANVSKYEADRPVSVEIFASLAESLWQLESPHRHGAPIDRVPQPIAREQAEAAFWLAVTLSTWCESGNLRRS